MGLLLGVKFPISGAALGALGGAIAGQMADLGVDEGSSTT